MFGEYTPIMNPMLMQRRLANGKVIIDDEVGLQKRCPRCKEYWPQDTLFWSPSAREPDGLQCRCKACQAEHRNERNLSNNSRSAA